MLYIILPVRNKKQRSGLHIILHVFFILTVTQGPVKIPTALTQQEIMLVIWIIWQRCLIHLPGDLGFRNTIGMAT